MTKIAMIGAGSTVFMKNLVGDILHEPLLKNAEISLMDIDEKRLATSEIVAGKVAEAVGARPRVRATTDRKRALDGADYVVTMIQVAGFKPGTVVDFEVPKKFGLRQTIADTLGVGGIMRGLRTVPVLIDIARDMAEMAPDALMLQYVNPMAAARLPAWCQRCARSASVTRCKGRRRSSRRTSACRSRRFAMSVPASTTWPST